MRSRPAPASRANNARSAAKNGLDTPFDTYQKVSPENGLDTPFDTDQKVSPEMLWGRRWRRCHHRRWKQRDGASHGTAARRLEPVPHSPGARQHDHGGD